MISYIYRLSRPRKGAFSPFGGGRAVQAVRAREEIGTCCNATGHARLPAMPRRRTDDEARRREINKEAWTEAELVARAHFEQRRRELLVEAGLDAPHRRSPGRRPDKLRDKVALLFGEGAFNDDAVLLDLVRAFLKNPYGKTREALRQHFRASDVSDSGDEC